MASTWSPEKAQLFSSAGTLCLAIETRDPVVIGVAEWFRDRARRQFLATPAPAAMHHIGGPT